jgi:hypothetical protein
MASHPKATDLPALLAKLCDAGIEFIVGNRVLEVPKFVGAHERTET